LALAACAAGGSGAGTVSASSAHPLLLVSLDGFRADYLARPSAARLQRLAASGVRAERLVPVFPTKTYPTHYTIITGLWPEHHGIVANTMYDPRLDRWFRITDTLAVRDGRWWGGEPLWVAVIRRGRRAHTMYWPGSEAPIHGVRPTEWRALFAALPNDTRVDEVLRWLGLPADRAPALVTLYLGDVDVAGHRFGPSGIEVDSAIAIVDRAIGRLLDGLEARGLAGRVNLIVVADHGMATIAPERVIFLDDYIDSSLAVIVDLNPVAALRPKPGQDSLVHARLARAHPNLTVYRKAEVPPRYHYRDHPRIAPIIAVADEGWTISTRGAGPPTDRGNHGFEPELVSMGGVFITAGPDFPRGKLVGPIHSVHLYALMTHLLGLEPAPNDGSLDSVRVLLR